MTSFLGLSNRVGNNSQNWPAYWASLVSATAEQAAPTNMVMTYSKANTSLLATDFTIAGKTITLLERDVTNKILTLTVSIAVAYGDSLTITFVKTGGTKAITNNITHPLVIDDGNSVAWFDAQENITKDGSDLVSAWGDKTGLAHHLLQATGTNQPLWSANGILFDGVDNFMKCAAFTWNQPEFIYIVCRQVTWTSNDEIFDGNSATERGTIYQTGTTPGLKGYAGVVSAQNNNLILNRWGIIRGLFNGASSKLQVNETTPITGDFGGSNMGGFLLGAVYTGTGQFTNIEVKEIILRKIADSESDEQAIYDYLKNKYLYLIDLARDFSGIMRYESNPIIPNGSEDYNTGHCDAPYIKYENKIGDTWYALTQVGGTSSDFKNITLYTSTNLINWTPYGVVLSNSTGEWDDNYLIHPCVIKIEDTWYCYYSAKNDASKYQIGVATSPDFINWTKHVSNPVYSIAGDCMIPFVKKIGLNYFMYYVVWTGDNTKSTIHYATSSDGISWIYGGLCLIATAGDWCSGKGLIDPWVIQRSDGLYEMVFATAPPEQKIGYAISDDGIYWVMKQNAILSHGVAGQFDAAYVGDGVLLEKPDGTIYLYYAGVPSSGFASGGLAIIE